MKTNMAITISLIVVLTWSIFLISENSVKKTYGEAIILKKEFIEKKTWFNPAIMIMQTDDEHYNYLIKVNDNTTTILKSNKDIYNINDKIKVQYKLGRHTKTVYDLNVL